MKHFGCFCKLVFFCICSTPFLLHAQVTINAQLPPGGMVKKEQLWNLILVNNKDILDVNIKLTLQDALTGQVMISANTGTVVLNRGVKVLTNGVVQPVMYNYNTADLSRNFLPMGTYIACYQLYRIVGDAEEPLSNECIRFHIDPLSPPLLSAPADKSKLQTPYPLFTWMPPTPVDMFSDLSYDIIVTEVLEGQSPVEAIEYNTPIYSRNNLMRPNENYPPSFSKLETDKTYAWQVIARNCFSYSVKTAVWTFIINKEIKPAATSAGTNYMLLEDDLKGTYIITNKQLHIKYASYDKEHEAAVIFSDANGNKMISIIKKIVQGDNYFDIDLNNHFQTGIIYNVTITDLAGKSQSLLFSIKQ